MTAWVFQCEALFMAAVDPTVLLSALPIERVGLLVDAAREFALRWMAACRKRKPIKKQVYGVAAGAETQPAIPYSLLNSLTAPGARDQQCCAASQP